MNDSNQSPPLEDGIKSDNMSKSGSKDVGGVDLKKLRNKKLTSTEFMQVTHQVH